VDGTNLFWTFKSSYREGMTGSAAVTLATSSTADARTGRARRADPHALAADIEVGRDTRGTAPRPAAEVATKVMAQQDQTWVATLRQCARGQRIEGQSMSDLYALLVRMARSQAYRAGPRWGLSGPELDDLAHHAAADSLLALAAKVDAFRGDARFSTWAFPFVRLAVLNALSRGTWSKTAAWSVELNDADLEVQALRHGAGLRDPVGEAEAVELFEAVRHVLVHALTNRQRQVLVAVVFEQVSVPDLAVRMQMTRNGVYKCVFDARRRLRIELRRRGFLPHDRSRSA
jgi:RNA polymerase sigma-70 factor (ECF subfamily)